MLARYKHCRKAWTHNTPITQTDTRTGCYTRSQPEGGLHVGTCATTAQGKALGVHAQPRRTQLIEDGPITAPNEGCCITHHSQQHCAGTCHHPTRPAYSLCMHIYSKGQGLNLEALSLLMSIALSIQNRAQAVQVRIQPGTPKAVQLWLHGSAGAFNRPYVITTCKWLIGQVGQQQHTILSRGTHRCLVACIAGFFLLDHTPLTVCKRAIACSQTLVKQNAKGDT